MDKKKLIIIIIIGVVLLGVGVGAYHFINQKPEDEPEKEVNKDALLFKQQYEELNGTENGDKTIRSITIPEDNPFVYVPAEEIVQMIKDEKSFYVYFGFAACPWCRSMLPTFIEVAEANKVDKIYYVDILDIRDTLEVNSKGKVETTKEGTDAYYELLELLDDVLSDYALNDSKGKAVKTKEKRIYAPNIVAIEEGKPVGFTEGISPKQEDAYGKLTSEMKKDMYELIEEVIKSVGSGVCTEQGC